jgi:SAM-dependent methyltransferase
MCLSRILPSTSILGLDYRRELIDLAELRRVHYRSSTVRFACSPDPDSLPVDVGRFDFIVFSAVYEHLLPAERPPLLARLWRLLDAGGVLFLNQTPYRYWPIETHTTRLPLINYLPDRFALATARAFSRRVPRDQTWDALLRRGVRGGTEREILRFIEQAGDGTPRLLEPTRFGLRDRIDLWYYVSANARPHRLKNILRHGLKGVRALSGVTLVPSLALAIRKAG